MTCQDPADVTARVAGCIPGLVPAAREGGRVLGAGFVFPRPPQRCFEGLPAGRPTPTQSICNHLHP